MFRDDMSRFAASVSMDKESLSLLPIAFEHTVDMPYGTVEGKSGRCLLGVGWSSSDLITS